MITLENWSYSCYQSDKFRVNISLGATISDSSETPEYIYFINKFDDEVLIHQQESNDLEQAITQSMASISMGVCRSREKLHSSGCSTCQAHD